MNRNSHHYDLFRPRDIIEVMDRAGYRGHGRGEFLKATVTDYTSRFQANEAWRVEFVYNETGEKGVVTLDNHFEEVRLLERPPELPPDDLCPVCRVEVGTDCFSICCDRCDNWVHGSCGNIDATEGREIKKYYCPPCRRQHGLDVVYKSKKRKHRAEGTTPEGKVQKHAAPEKVTPKDPTPQKPVQKAPPKVYEERECAYSECTKLHRNASKYCCPEHGRAQAMKKFQEEQARTKQQKARGTASPEVRSPKAKGMTRADAEDLAEFAKIQEKVASLRIKTVALEKRRKMHEEMVLANARRLLGDHGSMQTRSDGGNSSAGSAKRTEDSESDLPKVSPKSAAASKDSWLHDCPTCGKQARAPELAIAPSCVTPPPLSLLWWT